MISRRPVATFLPLLACAVSPLAACNDRPPSPPVLLQPQQGSSTGSVWSLASLAPLFRWTAVSSADRYRLQVDDSCPSASGCAFPSLEVDAMVDGTAFQSPLLPVASAPPVGRRYYWRASACAGATCGEWSPTFYVDVGRQREDFNGDGYADLVVAAPVKGEMGGVFVYLGGPTFASTPEWTVVPSGPTEVIGSQAAWAGDLDGDGFAELAFLATVPATPPEPATTAVRVYRGGVSPTAEPALTVPQAGLDWLHAANDVNGDGFADLYIGTATQDQSDHLILLGSGTGALLEPALRVGTYAELGHMLGSLDANDDGAFDLIFDDAASGSASSGTVLWGTIGNSPFTPRRTAALPALGTLAFLANGIVETPGPGMTAPEVRGLFFLRDATGSPSVDRWRVEKVSLGSSGSAGNCDGDLPLPDGGLLSVAAAAVVGDVDGDGIDDFLLGDPAPSSNRSVLYYGGCPVQGLVVLPGRDGTQSGGFGGARAATGQAVAGTGDLNGDGIPDFAVGNPFNTGDSFGTGEVYIYWGKPSRGPAPDLILTNPLNPFGGQDGFGRSLD